MPAKTCDNVSGTVLMLGVIFQAVDEDFWRQLSDADLVNGCEQRESAHDQTQTKTTMSTRAQR